MMKMTENSNAVELKEKPDSTGCLNILAYVPHTLRYIFRQGLNNVLKSYKIEIGKALRGLSTMMCPNDIGDEFDGIWKTPHIDDFPDAIVSAGFADLFRKEFIERFVSKGYFNNAWEGPVDKRFEEAGLVDSDGWCTLFSIRPYLMLVDKKRLGSLPVPRRWGDLLNPLFRGKLILPGSENEVSRVTLFYFYKEYGKEGIEMLARNAKAIWLSSEMARLAGSSKSEAAVYVMSWFFTESCPKRETVTAVWPEDGALANPISMLAKREKIEELVPVLRYTLGPEDGREYVRSCYPVINPQVDNMLPEGASFKWIGWDYIKSHDLEELRERTLVFFTSARKERKRT